MLKKRRFKDKSKMKKKSHLRKQTKSVKGKKRRLLERAGLAITFGGDMWEVGASSSEIMGILFTQRQ